MSWQTIIKENNLDISIVSFSQIAERIDAEYYRPRYLIDDKRLSKHTAIKLGDVSYVTDGQHGYHEEDDTSEIRFLTAKNARNWFADGENTVRVAKWVDDKNKRSSLQEKDLILSTRGTVGLCALVGAEILPSQIDQDVARICINTATGILPEFLLTYLSSEYGQDWMVRNSTGNVQQGLSLDKVRAIPIPKADGRFQETISKLVSDAKKKTLVSVNNYLEAEQLLLKEINLEKYESTEEAISVRTFSKVLADNRFDAEYWQPDFDVIQNAIKKHKDGYDTFDNLFVIADKKATIEPEKEYLYAELADVNGAMGTIDNFTVIQGKELPSRGRMSLKKDDVVMSSLDGSLSKIALITSEEKNIIGSTGFFVLRKKGYEPEVALVLLKSKPIQTLLERQGQGTILSAIPKSSLSRVLLPKLGPTIQKKIKELVLRAHEQKEEAKVLVEKAKRAVEIFVEKDEKEAVKYLNP